jgi:CSLREA domain-containing protein
VPIYTQAKPAEGARERRDTDEVDEHTQREEEMQIGRAVEGDENKKEYETMIQTRKENLAGVKKALALGFLLLAALIACLVVAKPAHAFFSTFTVNSTGDSKDSDIDNDRCDINGFLGGDQCTLRAAIEEANHTPGKDIIRFNISGSGVKTINVGATGLGQLPTINEAVIIDGYTQSGASPNTLATGNDAVLKIELNGTNAGINSHGLEIDAPDSVIRGLVINRFHFHSINVLGSGDRGKIEGNFLGTDASGTLDRSNSYGVVILQGSNITIGGTSPEARNVISGNAENGVFIGGNSNKVQGNYIGTDASGTQDLGNDFDGVHIITASSNLIGGNTSAAANTIAFNGGPGSRPGVSIVGPGTDALGNRILSNSIFSNGELGIDLGSDGKTPNDEDDLDPGPNALQNFPLITSATTSGGSTTIEGRLNSAPDKADSRTFKIQFFSNPSGNEGKNFIGQKSVTTTANDTTATFTFSPNQAVPAGQKITATATDPAGNTSEFSVSRTMASS